MVESADAVEEILESGYLFELTYKDQADETQRTYLVTHRKPHRPAMVPLTGPPVFYFESVGGDATHKVRLPELVAIGPVPVDEVAAPLTGAVLSSMVSRIHDEPESVPLADIASALEAARDAVDAEVDALQLALATLRKRNQSVNAVGDRILPLLQEAESVLGRAILREFVERADESPATVEPHVPALTSLAASSAYRDVAIEVVAALADSNPTVVLDAVPAVAAAAESTDEPTRRWAVYTLSVIAGEHPEEIYPAVGVLIEAIRDDSKSVRTNALAAVGKVTSSYPDAAEPVTDDLVELLDADASRTRNNAVGLLGDIAQRNPGAVVDAAEPIAELLTDSNIQARINASIALLAAGESDSESIRAQRDYLEQALDDASPEVRANACTLVGNAQVPVSTRRLRELRDDDLDATVREQAGWALRQR